MYGLYRGGQFYWWR